MGYGDILDLFQQNLLLHSRDRWHQWSGTSTEGIVTLHWCLFEVFKSASSIKVESYIMLYIPTLPLTMP